MKYTFLTHYSPEISDFSKVSVHTMDKGVYLKIYGYGHYGVIAPDTKNVLLDFIKRNQLKTDDHYIVFPFNQCWMTNKNPWLMTTMLRIRS